MAPISHYALYRLKKIFYLMPLHFLTRNLFYLFLLCCLFFPILFMLFYVSSVEKNPELFFIVPLLGLISAGGGWYVLKLWELKMQHSASELLKIKMAHLKEPPREQIEKMRRGYEHRIDLLQSSVAKNKNNVHHLNLEMDKKLEEMRIAYLEFEDLRKEYHRLENDYQLAKEENQAQLKHKDSLINEYQRTIAEQRMIIEKKQHYIAKLEGKVHDLMYEIRSLLQLENFPTRAKPPLVPSTQVDPYLPSSSHKSTLYDLSLKLQQYVEKAENLTGAEHLGYIGGKSPRFLDMPLDSFAIDRRRLFDSFRDETSGIIFIYSQMERKLVFVNHYVKTLLGWSPEKFMHEFPYLTVKGLPEWKKAISKISSMKEVRSYLILQSKSSGQSRFSCHMGLIYKGPFVNHVIGIFSPSSN